MFGRNSSVRAVDTNILVRLLEQDDPAQTAAAEAFLQGGTALWVSHLVLAETIWVLQWVFKRTKKELLGVLDALVNNLEIHIHEPSVVSAAIAHFRSSKAEFSDCLVLAIAQAQGHLPVATFDKNLAKLPGTVLPKHRSN